MKTTTPIYCMWTFFFFNTKPVACNDDDKGICIEAYVKTRERETKLGLNSICRRWPVIEPE